MLQAQVATHELVCRTCGGQLQFVRYADETHCLHVGKSHMHQIEPPQNAARLIARAENDAAFHRSVEKGLDVITPPTPRVELREFELRFWTDSDCQGKATITAENREQAKVILMHLPQYSCYKIWAD